jgi:phage shock protein C
MSENKLRRSAKNKVLGGLCGGLGEYFNIDPTIIRLVLILATFWIGIPLIIAYLIGLIIVSVSEQKGEVVIEEPVTTEQKDVKVKESNATSRSHLVWGWLIIGVGVIILIESLGYFNRIREYVFPGALIAAGIWVLVKGIGRRQI